MGAFVVALQRIVGRMMQIRRVENTLVERSVPGRPLKTLIAAVLVVLPAAIFYSILFRQAINVPREDDYEMILAFLNRMDAVHGGTAKAAYFVAAQFNEYKVFFLHAIVWLDVVLQGHLDFRLLCAIGNGFVVLLAILLWKMFLPECKNRSTKLILFLPVAWFIFQLNYVETLNWAGPSLQNIVVLPFSLGAIYFLMRMTKAGFYLAIVCLVLSVAASGNGFFLVPIGALLLVRRRLYASFAIWLMFSAGCIAVYAYHYNLMSSQSANHHSILATVIHARPLYFFGFVGSAISPAFYLFAFVGAPPAPRFHLLILLAKLSSLVLGFGLCLFFAAMMWRRYFRRNELVAHCILFVLLTALGVTAIRSDFGLGESLSSRYGMYSVLLLVFAWFAVVEEYLLPARESVRKRATAVAIAVAVLFAVRTDVVGWRYLANRDGAITRGMAEFEHSEGRLSPVLPFPDQPERMAEEEKHALLTLQESVRLGIYRPPEF